MLTGTKKSLFSLLVCVLSFAACNEVNTGAITTPIVTSPSPAPTVENPAPAPPTQPNTFDGVTLHLDPSATATAGDGSLSKPFQRFKEAYDAMQPLKEAGQNVRILFYPGMYRQRIFDDQETPFWGIPDNNAQLVLEAKTPGKAVITGSDVWNDWQAQGAGLWTRDWPYAFDATIPKSGGPPVPAGAVRREAVWVAGSRLKQVLALNALTPGSFFVDDAAKRISLKLEGNVNPNAGQTEVAVRGKLFYIWNVSNFTLRGLTFTHSADGFAQSAVAAQRGQGKRCKNFTVENVRVEENGQGGLESYCDNTVFRGNVVNANGFAGMLGGVSSGWTVEDNETNRNGWRSWAFGYKGWATAGLKFGLVSNIVIRRHKSLDNEADGLWIDTQNTNVTLEDSLIARNKWDGLFFEASDGPFVARNNTICNNGLTDMILGSVRQVRLENNRILSFGALNTEVPSQNLAVLLGETRRKEPGDSGEVSRAEYPLRDITLTGNTIVAGGGRMLVGSYWYFSDENDPNAPQSKIDFEAFITSFRSSRNTWFAEIQKAYSIASNLGYAEDRDFAGWRTVTGQDGDSSFSDPKLTCPTQ
jgi:Right handed beta helix region